MDERTHQHPVRMSALQTCAFCKRTAATAVVATDIAGASKDLAQKQSSETGMVPCLDCFGATLYCSADCRVQDIVDHTMECRRTRLAITKAKNERIGILRMKQLNLGKERGMPKLLGNMLDQLTTDEKLNNVYFLCMPFDTTQLVGTHSAIKACPRAGLVLRMVSPAMRQAFEWYIRHADDRKGHDFIYVFAYPPDVSFVEIVALPCDPKSDDAKADSKKAQAQQQKQAGLLEHTFQPCACSLHAGTST